MQVPRNPDIEPLVLVEKAIKTVLKRALILLVN